MKVRESRKILKKKKGYNQDLSPARKKKKNARRRRRGVGIKNWEPLPFPTISPNPNLEVVETNRVSMREMKGQLGDIKEPKWGRLLKKIRPTQANSEGPYVPREKFC